MTRYLPGPTTVESSLTYEYDTQAGGLTNYADIVQHDPARGTGYLTRGNVTKESRDWAESPDGAAAETAAEYDIAGNRVKVTTPKVESETGRVAGATSVSLCGSVCENGVTGKGTYAFASTVTNAEGQVQQRWYSWGAGGRPTKARDANGQETGYDYSDRAGPVEDGDAADWGDELSVPGHDAAGDDAAAVEAGRDVCDDDGGLRRAGADGATELSGGPKKAWQYDALGRVWKESNPTYGSFVWTSYLYDALERVTRWCIRTGARRGGVTTNNATLRGGRGGEVHEGDEGRAGAVESGDGGCERELSGEHERGGTEPAQTTRTRRATNCGR